MLDTIIIEKIIYLMLFLNNPFTKLTNSLLLTNKNISLSKTFLSVIDHLNAEQNLKKYKLFLKQKRKIFL